LGKTELDDATLQRVAQVCRLKLGEKEKAELRVDLNSILSYFSQINEIEEKGRELYYVVDSSSVPRQDVARPSNEAEAIRKGFAKCKDGMMMAPKSL